jgi:hypothetical protein
MPHVDVVTIGSPLIIACINVRGVPSKRLGNRKRSAAAKAAAVDASSRGEEQTTRLRRASGKSARTSSGDAPAPTTSRIRLE